MSIYAVLKSRYEFEQRSAARAADRVPAVPAADFLPAPGPRAFTLDGLTPGQKLALVTLRERTGSQAAAVMRHLRGLGWTATEADYDCHVAAGRADPGSLELTGFGMRQADELSWSLAKEHGLHHVRIRRHATGRIGSVVLCCCGWKRNFPQYTRVSNDTLLDYGRAHVAEEANGITREEKHARYLRACAHWGVGPTGFKGAK